MTRGLTIYLPEKPEFKEPIILPLGERENDFFVIELKDFPTKYNYISFMGWDSIYEDREISYTQYYGWNRANNCYLLNNWLGDNFWNKLGVSENGWFLMAEGHDSPNVDIFNALWISNLKNVRYKIFSINIEGHFRDITNLVEKTLKKIENLESKSNPLVNKDAIILIKRLSNKLRFIALDRQPEKQEAFRRI